MADGAADDESDDGGGWEDLDDGDLTVEQASAELATATIFDKNGDEAADGAGEWLADKKEEKPPPAKSSAPVAGSDEKPLYIVDFTVLTKGAVHNKFDKNAVNDIDLKKKFTLQVTKDIADEAKVAGMVASGVCHP